MGDHVRFPPLRDGQGRLYVWLDIVQVDTVIAVELGPGEKSIRPHLAGEEQGT